jgi:hypothetical protein
MRQVGAPCFPNAATLWAVDKRPGEIGVVSWKHTSSLPVIWSSFSAAFLSLELRQASTQSCARCLQGLTACSIRCKATGSRTDVLLQSINSFRSHRQATRDRRKARLRIMIAPCSLLAHARSHTICDSHARLRRIPVLGVRASDPDPVRRRCARDTSSFDLLAPSGGEMLFRISLR